MELAIIIGLISLGYGLYTTRAARQIADSGRDLDESEQKRRDGRREIITGLVLILLVAPAMFFFEPFK